ncbi:CMP-N-acetylneuraminate-beta-galactosamide-alpha-2,3-sialyltransferase 1 [Sphaerodactylus townsendi]|uniref:CMP-N-acetylneuraminate-beta-galactosamide- alpha-2,3-sialyltransferase 1 n=1 Tax=Sphaerodactylus townsendi TaxID=933632 RepID=UPI0020268D12|nr:CMP-N-acetylneuraminate-beta-galactosamide-alpha-2,3-sialyltransferase 1 [Sphaerodactylus townsendi]
MFAGRKRTLKVFTLTLFFVITITSFLLNYTHNTVMNVWDPMQIIDQFWKLVKHPVRPCSCNTCISEPGASSWFDERFNHTMQPLLTARNAVMPPESYKWWLVSWEGDEEGWVVGGAVSPAKFRLPSFACQVFMLNSPISFWFQRKPALYSWPTFTRIPQGFLAAILGGHFAVSYSVDIFFCLCVINVAFIKTTVFSFNSTYIPVPRKIKVTKDKILVYHPIFIKYVYDNWLRHHGRYPSTGFLSVIFALHICDELDLYGFGADTKGNWHHYWENNPSAGAFRQTGVHDGDFESNVTLNLASAYKIRIFKGR